MTAAATFCATLVDEWARAGLTDAVICPGSRNTPMALALAGDGRIRVHVQHDERSAAFMALGLGVASGRPAVVLTTSGTATVNLHPAVVEADLAGVPMIICTADRPPESRDRGAPQTIDQTHLYGRSARWFHDPGVPDSAAAGEWRALASRVTIEATGGRAGPVQLNLPFREPLVGEPTALPPEREDGGPWATAERVRTTAPSFPFTEIVRGVVVAGRSGADPDDVLALAAALGWPVIADPRSGCRIPHERVVAHADGFLRADAVAATLRPDAVLRLGEPPASRVVGEWLAAPGAREVVVADRHIDPHGSAERVIVGTPQSIVSAWAKETVPVDGRGDDWTALWRRVDDAAAVAIPDTLDDALSEPAIARSVVASAPLGSVLVTASSMPVRDVEWYATPRTGLTVVANRGANGIDGVTSTAVGIALTGVPTLGLLGDLAFLHDSNGLLGLGARGVDLTIVVVDNDGGGIFSFLPQRDVLSVDRYEQLFGTPHGVDPLGLAAAHGLKGIEIESIEALGSEVGDVSGVKVVVLRTDRDDNREVHRELNEAITEAARAAL